MGPQFLFYTKGSDIIGHLYCLPPLQNRIRTIFASATTSLIRKQMAVNFLSPPPLLLHHSYAPPDTGGSFIASNPMLIIAPAVIALLLLIFIACLLVYCREKPRNDIEISNKSLHDRFGEVNFGTKGVSKCGSDVTSSAIYSPGNNCSLQTLTNF